MQDHPASRGRIPVEVQSPCSTLLLPVPRESGSNDYSPVQPLRAVAVVIPIHPVVPDPYTLLSLLPTQSSWFTSISRALPPVI